MDKARYPPTPQSYPSNKGFHLHPSNSALPTPFVTPHRQTTATVQDTDTKPSRSLGVRTPSPTPSEAVELSRAAAFDWKRLAHWRFWFRRQWLWYYIILVFICTVTALVTLYHQEIVDFLRPAADWVHEFPAGFVIPIAILFVISFPPLFGHEIVAILCGLVWGLWPGFGIVCAGTFLGEVGNFYAFRHCCRSRGEKLERSNIAYACLAKVVRDGGFIVALVARLSAIPGHFTTAVFSTCGMNIVVFSLAALLSLPKQFITVYLGVALEQAANGEKSSTQDKLLKYSIITATLLITVWAMWYIYAQMGQVKTQVIYERRKARQMATLGRDDGGNGGLSHSVIVPTFPARPDGTSGRGWEECGNDVGWSNEAFVESTEYASRLAMGEERDTLSHGGDFTTGKLHHASHSTGPHMHGREVLATTSDPHQHIRTRSLSAFRREQL